MDDHSRFLVGYGLHASASSALVLETFRAAMDAFGAPEEVLTDNGPQYVTWRGTSACAKECQKRGVKQAAPPDAPAPGKKQRRRSARGQEAAQRMRRKAETSADTREPQPSTEQG